MSFMNQVKGAVKAADDYLKTEEGKAMARTLVAVAVAWAARPPGARPSDAPDMAATRESNLAEAARIRAQTAQARREAEYRMAQDRLAAGRARMEAMQRANEARQADRTFYDHLNAARRTFYGT